MDIFKAVSMIFKYQTCFCIYWQYATTKQIEIYVSVAVYINTMNFKPSMDKYK